MSPPHFQVGILGDGVIGLSLAWELCQQGVRVIVLGGGSAAGTATWAAAGMLPPMSREHAQDPLDQLQALSCDLYPAWIERLERASGIPIEYWQCGACYVARSAGEVATLRSQLERWSQDGIRFRQVPLDTFPCLSSQVKLVYLLPDEAQVRPPRLLQALRAAVQSSGAVFLTVAEPPHVELAADSYLLQLAEGHYRVDKLCITAGAWSGALLQRFGASLRIEPRRGQMALFAPNSIGMQTIINEGLRYLVPRRDGRILVGSTVEEVGFNARTVDADIAQLTAFARGLVPALAQVPLESHWAGLRPYTGDGYPYLGQLPRQPNLFVATGHFRSGVLMAPATARLMRQLLLDQEPELDLHAFRVDRD